ncbi:hypothetical protein KJ836_00620 [Patescibacteria group bacterium]|nr:hypothetical protein [Patescibacteria group bacterium]
MARVKNATELIKWISTKIGQIVLWIEDGTRTVEELSPLKEAIQAVIDRRPFRIEFLPLAAKPSVLGAPYQITLPALTGSSDPKKFFKTRNGNDGLYVWDGFRDRILSVTDEVESLLGSTISSFDLSKAATDADIRNELPEGHVWQDASAFCACLAGLIERQKNGEEGDLITTGCANIFYVVGIDGEVFTVHVSWYSDARKWRIRASTLDDFQWLADSRAFSATAVA